MSEATNRVLEAQLRRQKQHDKRQKEWETALKPTTIDGSGVLRQLGQQPLDNRQILPNTASLNRPIRPTAVPGGVVADWLPRVKKVVVEYPVKKESFIPGLWLIYDVNWWNFNTYTPYTPNNFGFILDLYNTKLRSIYHLDYSDSRVFKTEGRSVVDPSMQYGSVEVAGYLGKNFEATPEIPATLPNGSVFILILFSPGSRLTTTEFAKLKSLAQRNRVVVQCEWNTWSSYNLRIQAGLGLTGLLNDRGNYTSNTKLLASNYPQFSKVKKLIPKFVRYSDTSQEFRHSAERLFYVVNPETSPILPVFCKAGTFDASVLYVPPTALT